jgi:hypothetical protein
MILLHPSPGSVNRFWLVLVALYTVVAGFKYLEHRIMSNVNRLQVAWGTDETPKAKMPLSLAR